MNYANKVVVITGASSGIGEESAVEFAKQKSKVVLVSRNKQ
ncbi:MAG TPA: SDR family NAD(P)-dependent oxidoreductase, partial [Nitrosopumilaceae archaeon]|nr:SDR family NAD(P)-dependent oxidoreductase [Nitrosopumilaceae archaeon]